MKRPTDFFRNAESIDACILPRSITELSNAPAASRARTWMETLCANALVTVSGAFGGVIIARALGPEGRGNVASIILWPQVIAGVGLLSLNEATTLAVGRRKGDRGPVIASALLIAVLASLPVLLAGRAALGLFFQVGNAEYGHVAKLYLALLVPLYLVYSTGQGALQGKFALRTFNILRAVAPAGYSIGLGVLWATHTISVVHAVSVSLVSSALAMIGVVWMLRDEIHAWPTLAEMAKLLKTALRFHGATVLFLLCSQIDKLWAIAVLDARAAGFYVVASGLATTVLGIFTQSIYFVAFPDLSRRDDTTDRRRLTGQYLQFATFAGAILSVTVMAALPWGLPFIYGSAFKASVDIGLILVIASVLFGLRQIAIRSLKAWGHGLPGAVSEGITLLVVGLGVAATWPKPTAIQIAALYVCGNVVGALYLMAYLSHGLRIPMSEVCDLRVSTVRRTLTRLKTLAEPRRPN